MDEIKILQGLLKEWYISMVVVDQEVQDIEHTDKALELGPICIENS